MTTKIIAECKWFNLKGDYQIFYIEKEDGTTGFLLEELPGREE